MDPFEVLEIAPGATADEIKAAYHRLAKRWHPDRFTGVEKEEAEKRFRMLAEAFNMLKNTGREAVPPPPPPPSAPSPEVAPSIELGAPAAAPALERSAADWFKEAEAAFAAQHFEQAASLAQYSVRLDGNRSEYRVLVAKALEASDGDQRLVVKAYECAIRLNPKDVDSIVRLAEIFQSLGMHARATRLWKDAHELAPDHQVFAKNTKSSGTKNQGDKAAGLGEQWNALMEQGRSLVNRLLKRG